MQALGFCVFNSSVTSELSGKQTNFSVGAGNMCLCMYMYISGVLCLSLSLLAYTLTLTKFTVPMWCSGFVSNMSNVVSSLIAPFTKKLYFFFHAVMLILFYCLLVSLNTLVRYCNFVELVIKKLYR